GPLGSSPPVRGPLGGDVLSLVGFVVAAGVGDSDVGGCAVTVGTGGGAGAVGFDVARTMPAPAATSTTTTPTTSPVFFLGSGKARSVGAAAANGFGASWPIAPGCGGAAVVGG